MPDTSTSNEQNDNQTQSLALIIPTFNAEQALRDNIAGLSAMADRVLVSDGSSTDGTLAIAKMAGAEVISGGKGRGHQLERAAERAKSGWLLFIHADTRLDEDAAQAISDFIRDRRERQVGYFDFKLDQNHDKAVRLERRVAWRCRHFALPYGDQGLLIHSDLYRKAGGYKPIPLMEDVDLIWRLHKLVGKQAIVRLGAKAITSAEKFERDGYFLRSARNLFCLFLFRIGVPASMIARLYS